MNETPLTPEQSFDQFLDRLLGPLPADVHEATADATVTGASVFTIDDDSKASWALRKIARLDAAVGGRGMALAMGGDTLASGAAMGYQYALAAASLPIRGVSNLIRRAA